MVAFRVGGPQNVGKHVLNADADGWRDAVGAREVLVVYQPREVLGQGLHRV